MGPKFLSRRDMLMSTAAVLAATLSGCTPLRIGFRLYPDDFDRDTTRVDRILRAFVATIVPGADINHHNFVRHFYDRTFPLATCRSFMAAELCGAAADMYQDDRFEHLTPEHRVSIVQAQLNKGGTTTRIFTGAIFLTQIAHYAGIYDDDEGCDLIGFAGKYRVRSLTEISFPDCDRFAARWITTNGNPS